MDNMEQNLTTMSQNTVRLKRGSGYGTERMRNGTERIWRNGTDMGLNAERNGTERIWG
jgi:hypothetical protein